MTALYAADMHPVGDWSGNPAIIPARAGVQHVAFHSSGDEVARSFDITRLSGEILDLKERIAALRSAYESGEDDLRGLVEASLAEATQASEQLELCLNEVVGQVEDLSRRQEYHEGELRLLRGLYRQLPLPVLVLDENAVVRRANGAACTLLNVSAAFATGKPFPVFIDLARRAMFRSRFAKTARTGLPAEFGTRVVRGDGVSAVRLRLVRLDLPAEPHPRIAVLLADFSGAEPGPGVAPERRLLLDADERLELLTEADRQLLGEDAFDEAVTARRLADLLTERFADWAVLDMRDVSGMVRRRAVATADPVDRPRARALLETMEPLAASVPAGVITGERPAVLEPVIADASLFGGPPERPALTMMGAGSLICVPIQSGDWPIGAITLIRSAERRRFGLPDLGIAQRIGEHLALAQLRQRMYARRSDLADVLQRSLIPAADPAFPGVTLRSLYRSCAPDQEVGGDFYDVFRWGEHIGVVLGDVSGKGAGAAVLTATARYGIRMLAQDGGAPDHVLRQVNRALLDHGEDDRFVTAVLGTVRTGPAGLTVRLTSAGHPRTLIRRADGTVNVGLGGGLPLGLVDELPVETQEFTIGPGETMLLYTDGVIEARDPDGELYGEEGLAAVLARSTGRPIEMLLKDIDDDIAAFTRGSFTDDIAVLALRAGSGQ